MASVRITAFGGLMPEVHSALINRTNAQLAHNCLLTDGKLRPYAKWVEVDRRQFSPKAMGIAYDRQRKAAMQYPAFDPVTLNGAPFAEGVTVGIEAEDYSDRPLRVYTTGNGNGDSVRAGVPDYGFNSLIQYSRSYDSIKPMNRIYGATHVRKRGNNVEEGVLHVLSGQSPTDIVYEGDTVDITIYANELDGSNYVRIYRTITGIDTGQQVTNELDTNWHLVAELHIGGSITQARYIDGASATGQPLDLNYTATYHPLYMKDPIYFGLAESGWFVVADRIGNIAVSERYKHHAWPTENYFSIPEDVTDMAIHMDNAYFGTDQRPYIMALSQGEKPMQGAIVPFNEHMPCLPGTMTTAAFGVLYASGKGVVSLTRDGLEVITRDMANAGSILAVRRFNDNGEVETAEVRFSTTVFGHYYAGQYFGFCFKREPIDDYTSG